MTTENGKTLAAKQNAELTTTQFDEVMRQAEIFAQSSLVPPQYKGKAADIVVAILTGREVNLPPLRALQSIAVISGRPCVFGDAALGIVRASGLVEFIEETTVKDGEDITAICRTKRKGEANIVERRFTVAMAKKAGLLGKAGPWQSYPARMLQMRARSWALRDTYPDVLCGIGIREEVEDIPVAPMVVMPRMVGDTESRALTDVTEFPAAIEPTTVQNSQGELLPRPGPAPKKSGKKVTTKDVQRIITEARKFKVSTAMINAACQANFDVMNIAALPQDEVENVIAWIQAGGTL